MRAIEIHEKPKEILEIRIPERIQVFPSPHPAARTIEVQNYPNLNERDIKMLNLLAQGLTYKEISLKLFLAPKTVRNYMQTIYEVIGAQSQIDVVMKGIDKKLINVEDVTKDLSLEGYKELSVKEATFLEKIMSSHTQSSYQELAKNFDTNETSIKTILSRLRNKLGAGSTANAVVIYCAGKARFGPIKENLTDTRQRLEGRDKAILQMIGFGLTNKEIALNLSCSEKTVKNYVLTLYKRMGFSSRTDAALKAVDMEVVNPMDASQKFDLGRYKWLTSQQKKILQYIADTPTHSSDEKVAEAFGLVKKTIKNYMSDAIITLGVKNRIQAIIFHLAVSQ